MKWSYMNIFFIGAEGGSPSHGRGIGDYKNSLFIFQDLHLQENQLSKQNIFLYDADTILMISPISWRVDDKEDN